MKNKFINKFIFSGFCILGIFSFTDIFSQDTIISDSIINKYTKVISLHSTNDLDADSVFVEDASEFKKNEVALFIVNRGASVYYTGESLKGTVRDMNNTGKYILIYIDTVDYNNDLIIFNTSIPDIISLSPSESAQLVSVPRYRNAVVTDKLTCKEWDPLTGTGGVTAMIVDGVLQLEADIDVSGKGFRGASPAINEKYEGSCSSEDSLYFHGFFSSSARDSAGLKGEGIISSDYYDLYPRGRDPFGNGGGGGECQI